LLSTLTKERLINEYIELTTMTSAANSAMLTTTSTSVKARR
jgi:hypothetical protein